VYQGPCSRLRYCARAGGGDRPFRIPRIVCTVKLTKWRSLAAECALAAVFLAACTAIVVRTIPKASPPPPPPSPHVASLPADGRARATLQVVTGTLVLTIGVADPGSSGTSSGTLLRASTPAGSPPPQLRLAGGGATGRSGKNAVIFLSAKGASAITVTLNAAVSWQFDFAGGTRRTVADLRGGRVAGITVTKGSDVIDLTLPRPRGSVPVRLAAGASQFLLRLPGGVPVRLTAAAGAGEISLGGRDHTRVADGSVFTTPGWMPGAAGFDIDATAGAARVAVTTWTS
jgi:hypothetical protein